MAAINYQEPIPAECKCKLPLMELTSWTLTNPYRRFLVCPNRYLDNAWYRGHLYGMYGQLNPHQIQDIAIELTCHEQLIILQDEFVGLQAELAQTQKNARTSHVYLRASPGWVIIKQKTSEFLQELAERDDERVQQLQSLARETEERAAEKMVFIEKLKGNTPF
ncbi:hypothetical protein Tco_0783878 [Tanacetum coccineum]